jgi:hypothetical protein
MKRLIILILFLLISVFGISACVDIDEALPHYNQVDQNGPQK